jgi:antitoxin CptB
MESREIQERRLRLRAWRRGIREMDLTLGPYADARLATMTAAEIAAFEALLAEADLDILPWVLGQQPAPAAHAPLVARLADFMKMQGTRR